MMTLEDLIGLLDPLEYLAGRTPLKEVHALTADSRQAVEGGAYFALRGYVTDGHHFISDALSKGVGVVVCEEIPVSVDERCCYIRVADCRTALAAAAAEWFGHPASSLRVIGVTGTNGKTTTARLIRTMLDRSGVKTGYIGTGQALIGDESIVLERTTPEAMDLHALFRKMVNCGCEAVVMEVSSHALVLHRTEGISFYGAVFTNLTPEHLDFHATMDEYGSAKQILFRQVAPDGFGIVNADDAWGSMMAGAFSGSRLFCCTVGSQVFGCTNGSVVRARDIEARMDGSSVTVQMNGRACRASFLLPGLFNVMNMLEILSAGVAMGLSLETAAASVADVVSVEGRMEPVSDDGGLFSAIVDYAHTPDALEKVIGALNEVRPADSSLIVVFGCGGDRDRSKRPLMGGIAAAGADHVILTSDNPRSEDPEEILDAIASGITEGSFMRIADRADAIVCGVQMLRPGDLLLIAGKGHECYQESGGRKSYFSDREVVARALQERAD
ncbi:UDP-N-acetylmuramyl-tripeptide synthetase [Prosthecochloris aestuarii DSM 271]|uniref:UDP-N-acetylmuramoyl-L-alanyl-D-glutamate--2,6-diaminopimelate ligase n=2 Tax=Prosthecochloris TaxID=1101 RepID=B4S6R4_PROA2|nr:UDP-N-acetylmuramoyl-L-alanyl-D-glutamate--2,6-diaminopimelate ligase [Prosthecochloris aestuarii]ACF47269.1 UDP-N-acetylmuramyl-tripeptide synthetase [Prosthecochloris aestuarii DSM 271]